LAWTCKQCPKEKPDSLHPYTCKLLNMFELQRGGYPFEKNDLTLEEWIDLGRIKEALKPHQTCPLMTKK
jgi:hypothetical protein